MFGHVLVCVLAVQPLLMPVASFLCSNHNCGDCVNSRFTACRWCKRDNRCHMPGAIATNPCKRAENIVLKSHCGDEFPRYDPDLSYKMLLLSAAAYDAVHAQQCLDNALPSAKFQLQTVVTRNCDKRDNKCSGYVPVSHVQRAIVIAFRGTVSSDQVLAQILETRLVPKANFFKGKVQSYWKRGFEKLWPSMESKVKSLVSANPSYQIWVAGFSLGAAMASLTSTWLAYYNIAPRKNIILYTFGMPRVGDYKYALQHDQLVNNSWRVVNFDDAVPHFPFVIGTPSMFFGPYHHGVEVFYSEEAVSVNSRHRMSRQTVQRGRHMQLLDKKALHRTTLKVFQYSSWIVF